ncbi:acyl-CoA oxidase, partial [Mycolicibacterium austroafricanum]
TTSDCHYKGGLPGVDNGRIQFDQVRVPRQNLLNRYADVAADGDTAADQGAQHREEAAVRVLDRRGVRPVGGDVGVPVE